MNKGGYKVILFYKFERVRNPAKFCAEQKRVCAELGLTGRMLVAEEGVNATFEGKEKDIKKYIRKWREGKFGAKFKDVVFKESVGNGEAFNKLEIKVRPEVVTLGAGKFNVRKETAPTVTASELEKMYRRKEDFVVLDLRNDYEISVGKFENTVDPSLENFRELPEKLENIKDLKNKKVVAVCTGGIRCDKATCLLQKKGFKNLYQLKDGIHAYMKKYPGSHFKGSLFVFDNRMTTPVVDTPNREVIGQCIYCGKKCEDFYSDERTRPSRKIISCKSCAKLHSDILRRAVV